MPANTTKGYPYPLGTDRIMDGDDAIKNLAQAMDTKSGISAAGTVTIPFTAATTATSVTVTFPVGRFTVAPSPVVTAQITAPQNVTVSVAGGSVTTTGMTVWGYRYSGNSQIGVFWIARYAD